MDLTPQTEADSITIKLPKYVNTTTKLYKILIVPHNLRATKEAREALVRQVSKLTEELKVSIRRSRQNSLSDLKKKKDDISKDDFRKLENDVHTPRLHTKRFV
mgnify:CR=1 FL=1